MTPTSDAPGCEVDRSVLRYVLLQASRLNMLALERRLQSLRDVQGRLRMAMGTVRSERRHRAALTLQLAVEVQLAEPELVRWMGDDQDGLRRQLAIDAAYYLSHRWETDIPDPSPERFGPGPLSMRSLGQADDFARYLAERARIHEDRPLPTLEGREGKAEAADHQEPDQQAPRRSLPEISSPPPMEGREERAEARDHRAPDELRLRRVAQAVLRMLQSDYSLEHWHQAVEARRDAALRPPEKEVYDALLYGERSLVDETGFWRHEPAAKTVGPDQIQALLKDFEDFQLSVAKALGLPLVEGGDFVLLGFLSEQARVLSTSPAAIVVERAARNLRRRLDEGLESADQQISSGSSGDGDAELLSEFLERLKVDEPNLVDAIRAAVVLSGEPEFAERESSSLARLMAALVLLSEGLRFSSKSAARIGSALDRFFRQVEHAAGTSSSPELAAVVEWLNKRPSLAELPEAIKSLRSTQMVAYSLAVHANERAMGRLLLFAETGQVYDASAEEIVAARRRVEVYRYLHLDPTKNTPRAWSALLLASAEGGATNVPAGAAPLALWYLGIGTLSGPVRQRLLHAQQIWVQDSLSKEDYAALNSRLAADWVSDKPQDEWVIQVGGASSIAPGRYVRPDRFAMEFNADDAYDFMLRGSHLIRAFPGPISLRFDPDVPEERVLAIRRRFALVLAPPTPSFWRGILRLRSSA